MKLYILTQYRENYGAHDWDGTGECPQYWKNKGGCDYLTQPLTHQMESWSQEELASHVHNVMAPNIERSDDYCQEFIVHWELVADDFVTESERDQMEYEGKILYPASKLNLFGELQ